MYFQALLSLGCLVIWLISLYVGFFIITYIKSKPLGMQTLHDLIIIKSRFYFYSFNTSMCFIFMVAINFKEGLGWKNEFLIFILIFTAKLLFCRLFLLLIVKNILIFRQQWISDIPDKKVINYLTALTFFLTTILMGLNFPTSNGKQAFMILLTKNENAYR